MIDLLTRAPPRSGSSQYNHTADPHSQVTLHVGNLDAERMGEFQESFSTSLARAKERKGDSRSAATNKQGHQRTPPFIYAVACDALANIDADSTGQLESNPRGGFTDVGLHTGGAARDTCWPLVRAVFHFGRQHLTTIAEPLLLFRRYLAQFDIYILERVTDVEETDLDVSIDDAMKMISAAAVKGASLFDHQYNLGGNFEHRLAVIRAGLEQVASDRAQRHADAFIISSKIGEALISGFRHPTISVAPSKPPERVGASLGLAYEHAAKNINWLSTADDLSIATAHRCMAHARCKRPTSDAAQFALAVAEKYLFAVRFYGWTWEELELLRTLVESYRDVLHRPHAV